jgi:signal transduction histidine kinase
VNTDTQVNEYILRSAQITEVINEVLEFTHDYEVIGVKAPAWQDLHVLVALARAQVELHGIQVTDNFPRLELFADALLPKVIYNLVENAVRHGEQVSTIRFFTEQDTGTLVVICEDDGVGICEEDKPRLFTRGFGKNTGLGLFLAREILMFTGITIRETGIPGKGARFELRVLEGAYRFDTQKNG